MGGGLGAEASVPMGRIGGGVGCGGGGGGWGTALGVLPARKAAVGKLAVEPKKPNDTAHVPPLTQGSVGRKLATKLPPADSVPMSNGPILVRQPDWSHEVDGIKKAAKPLSVSVGRIGGGMGSATWI